LIVNKLPNEGAGSKANEKSGQHRIAVGETECTA